MTTNQFEFSLERMRNLSGSGSDDAKYLRWFGDTCVRRIHDAAATIAEIANGEKPFDNELPATLRANIGAVRFGCLALREAQDQFRLKADLAQIFTEAIGRVAKVVETAEQQALEVNRLFILGE